MISVGIKSDNLWKKYRKDDMTIYLKGKFYSCTVNELLLRLKNIERDSVAVIICSLDGSFSFVIESSEFCLLVVDKVRSSPLFFTEINEDIFIDHHPRNLVNKKKFNKEINANSMIEVFMSGYTIGSKTIYKNLHSLRAGEIVIFSNNNYKRIQYYKYFNQLNHGAKENLIEELSEVTINVFKKMIKGLNGRQIIIPLSAGNDSRLVASVLKYIGVENVKCYSYGTPGNHEAKIAEIISRKLGYQWIFVPLSHKSEKEYYTSKDYKKFLDFSETFSSVPFIQGLSTIKYLKEMRWIDDDAVFINGNSGDFISGGHAPNLEIELSAGNDFKCKKEFFTDSIINKHFSLWGHLKTKENIKKIKETLWGEIIDSHIDLNGPVESHQLYEYSEFIDRQSKYVISGQRTYEFYGHEWRMPLWDDEYLYFWQKIPYQYKENQNLYKDMLKKKNFANVWRNIPVNKKTITPKWIIPVRFLLKIPFGLFGKRGGEAWKGFERGALYYWMDVTHMMDSVGIKRIARDFYKSPRHHVSWLSSKFVSKYSDNE